MHWTGTISNELALEMAKNIEKMFGGEDTQLMLEAPKGGRRKKIDGQVPKKKMRTPRSYVHEWASKANAYMTMLTEVKAQLEGKPAWTWTASVQEDLLAHKEAMVGIHSQFVSLTQKVPADQTPLSDVCEYDDLCKEIEKFRQLKVMIEETMEAADNMLRNKKRKFPCEPAAMEEAPGHATQ